MPEAPGAKVSYNSATPCAYRVDSWGSFCAMIDDPRKHDVLCSPLEVAGANGRGESERDVCGDNGAVDDVDDEESERVNQEARDQSFANCVDNGNSGLVEERAFTIEDHEKGSTPSPSLVGAP